VALTDSRASLSTPVCGLKVALALTAAIERSVVEASDASTLIAAGSSTDAVAPMEVNEAPSMALNEVTAAVAVLVTAGADTHGSPNGMNATVAQTENEPLPTATAALAAAGAPTSVPTGSNKAETVKVTTVERNVIKVTEAVSATVAETIRKAAINDGASTSASYAEVCARKALAVISTVNKGHKTAPEAKVSSTGSVAASQRSMSQPELGDGKATPRTSPSQGPHSVLHWSGRL